MTARYPNFSDYTLEVTARADGSITFILKECHLAATAPTPDQAMAKLRSQYEQLVENAVAAGIHEELPLPVPKMVRKAYTSLMTRALVVATIISLTVATPLWMLAQTIRKGSETVATLWSDLRQGLRGEIIIETMERFDGSVAKLDEQERMRLGKALESILSRLNSAEGAKTQATDR